MLKKNYGFIAKIFVGLFIITLMTFNFILKNQKRNQQKQLDYLHNKLVTVEASVNLAKVSYLRACVEMRIKQVGKKNGSLVYCRKEAQNYKKEIDSIVYQQIKSSEK